MHTISYRVCIVLYTVYSSIFQNILTYQLGASKTTDQLLLAGTREEEKQRLLEAEQLLLARPESHSKADARSGLLRFGARKESPTSLERIMCLWMFENVWTSISVRLMVAFECWCFKFFFPRPFWSWWKSHEPLVPPKVERSAIPCWGRRSCASTWGAHESANFEKSSRGWRLVTWQKCEPATCRWNWNRHWWITNIIPQSSDNYTILAH